MCVSISSITWKEEKKRIIFVILKIPPAAFKSLHFRHPGVYRLVLRRWHILGGMDGSKRKSTHTSIHSTIQYELLSVKSEKQKIKIAQQDFGLHDRKKNKFEVYTMLRYKYCLKKTLIEQNKLALILYCNKYTGEHVRTSEISTWILQNITCLGQFCWYWFNP